MTTETDYLRSIAEDLILKAQTESERLLPDKHLVAEASRVKKNIIAHLLQIDNFPQREIFYFNTLSNLVDICDILYQPGNPVNADVKVMLGLLTEVKKIIPSEISPDLQLPNAFIALQGELVLDRGNAHREIFKVQGVEQRLIAIAVIPFRLFTGEGRKLYWHNFTWLKGYEEKLDSIDWENADCNSKTEALISVLLNSGFNDDRFFIYCKKYIIERTGRYGTKKRRLAEFAECEKLILQDTLDGFPSYNHRRPDISKKLIDWIGIEIKAMIANDNFNEEDYRIEFNLDGESLSVFWKHLMEHGITKQVNLDLYAKQIVATCSSKDTAELKWTTIKSKFHYKKPEYLKRIYYPLLAIIEDIKRFLKV